MQFHHARGVFKMPLLRQNTRKLTSLSSWNKRDLCAETGASPPSPVSSRNVQNRRRAVLYATFSRRSEHFFSAEFAVPHASGWFLQFFIGPIPAS